MDTQTGVGPESSKMFEILMAVLGLAVVAGLIFVIFVRPHQQGVAITEQNDSNVVAIRRALDQARADAGGDLSVIIKIPAAATRIGSAAGEINLCPVLVPSYLATMPFSGDVVGGSTGKAGAAYYQSCSDYETGYAIKQDATGVVTVE